MDALQLSLILAAIGLVLAPASKRPAALREPLRRRCAAPVVGVVYINESSSSRQLVHHDIWDFDLGAPADRYR